MQGRVHRETHSGALAQLRGIRPGYPEWSRDGSKDRRQRLRAGPAARRPSGSQVHALSEAGYWLLQLTISALLPSPPGWPSAPSESRSGSSP